MTLTSRATGDQIAYGPRGGKLQSALPSLIDSFETSSNSVITDVLMDPQAWDNGKRYLETGEAS